jgi:hypothetical protein
MKKGGIRQKTIDSMVSFLNLLKGQTLTGREVNNLARELNIRANVHNFALQLNFCGRKDKLYVFADYDFEPIHARQLIKLSNEYNVRIVEEARMRKEEKEKNVIKDAVEITEKQNLFGQPQESDNAKKEPTMAITDYFQNLFGGNKNSIYSESKLLQEENDFLKKNNEDLLFEIRNLKAQISALELKISALELQHSVKNNLSNFDEEEIEMLRGKVEGFEKLFSFYFK